MRTEKARILGIQAEYKTYTESVQTLLGVFICRILILFVESVMNLHPHAVLSRVLWRWYQSPSGSFDI